MAKVQRLIGYKIYNLAYESIHIYEGVNNTYITLQKIQNIFTTEY